MVEWFLARPVNALHIPKNSSSERANAVFQELWLIEHANLGERSVPEALSARTDRTPGDHARALACDLVQIRRRGIPLSFQWIALGGFIDVCENS